MKRDIFISYSRKDSSCVKRIKKEIESYTQVKCWMDLEGIDSGSRKFRKVIVDGINNSHVFLFMLSEYSQESDNAIGELELALRKNRDTNGRLKVVLVNIDNCRMNDEFYMSYCQMDIIDWGKEEQKEKLLRDIKRWIPQIPPSPPPKPRTSFIKTFLKKTISLLNIVCGVIARFFSIFKKWVTRNRNKVLFVIAGCLVVLVGVIMYPIIISQINDIRHQEQVDTKSGEILDTITNASMSNSIPEGFVLCPSGILNNYEEDNKKDNYRIDSFYISKYETMQLDWKKIFPEDTLFKYSGFELSNQIIEGDSLPIYKGYLSVIRYCIEKSQSEGYDGFYSIENGAITYDSSGNGYRLPTLLEWVYAARGFKEKMRYAATNNLKNSAWYLGNSGDVPHVVGQKDSNIIGLYDMNGNVSEFIWPPSLHEYSVRYPLWIIGGSFSSYIGLEESECFLSKEAGLRLVFIPREMKNNNIAVKKIRYYK